MFSKMTEKDLTIYLTGRALSGASQQLSQTNDATVAQRIGESAVIAARCAIQSLKANGYFGDGTPIAQPAKPPVPMIGGMPMVAGFIGGRLETTPVQPLVAQSQPVQPRSNPNGSEETKEGSTPQVQHGSPQDLGKAVGETQ